MPFIRRNGASLTSAATKTRDRLASELGTLAIVVTLLAAASLAAAVRKPWDGCCEPTSKSSSGGGDNSGGGGGGMISICNATYNNGCAVTIYNGSALLPGQALVRAVDTAASAQAAAGQSNDTCDIRCNQKFIEVHAVCMFLSSFLSLLLTGMFARLASNLCFCPDRRGVLWFLWRFGPTISVMHDLLSLNLILTGLGALFWVLGAWYKWDLDQQHKRHAISASAVATLCLLYYLYFHTNSFFDKHHGMLGVVQWNPRIKVQCTQHRHTYVHGAICRQASPRFCDYTFAVDPSFPYAQARANNPGLIVPPSAHASLDELRAYRLALHFALLRILEVEYCRLLMEEPYHVWDGFDLERVELPERVKFATPPKLGVDGCAQYTLVDFEKPFPTKTKIFDFKSWWTRKCGGKAAELLQVMVEPPPY